MKAAVTSAVGAPFRVEDVAIDAPLGHEVLIDVAASGLCHSDLTVARKGLGVPFPIVLGHEVAGVVVAVGPLVTEFSPGDHVAGCLIPNCGSCERCLTGRPYECRNPDAVYRAAGETPRLGGANGSIAQFWGLSGFAEQVLTHENQLALIPKNLPFDRACLLGCAVATGVGAVVNTAQLSFGESAAVFGAGGVGLNVIQGAALSGARTVIVVDPQEKNRERARAFGATHVIDPTVTTDVGAVIYDLSNGGVDHAFDAVGRHDVVESMLKGVGPGGQAYLIGLQAPGEKLGLDLDAQFMVPQIALRGVRMGSTNLKRDIPLYAELYLQGRLNLDDLVSIHIQLDEIDAAYEQLSHGGIARAVIQF